jgi:hypothetical protein
MSTTTITTTWTARKGMIDQKKAAKAKKAEKVKKAEKAKKMAAAAEAKKAATAKKAAKKAAIAKKKAIEALYLSPATFSPMNTNILAPGTYRLADASLLFGLSNGKSFELHWMEFNPTLQSCTSNAEVFADDQKRAFALVFAGPEESHNGMLLGIDGQAIQLNRKNQYMAIQYMAIIPDALLKAAGKNPSRYPKLVFNSEAKISMQTNEINDDEIDDFDQSFMPGSKDEQEEEQEGEVDGSEKSEGEDVKGPSGGSTITISAILEGSSKQRNYKIMC